jgi:hypothetical protein
VLSIAKSAEWKLLQKGLQEEVQKLTEVVVVFARQDVPGKTTRASGYLDGFLAAVQAMEDIANGKKQDE